MERHNKGLFALPLLGLSLVALLVSACSSQSIFDALQNPEVRIDGNEKSNIGDFPGCTSAEAISTSEIDVHFEMPPSAARMNIYRDGKLVDFEVSRAVTTFRDSDLGEGRSYRYVCEALVNGKYLAGFNAIQIATLAISAPSFTGIDVVTASSPNSVTVNWKPADARFHIAPSYYLVYASLGGAVDFTAEPRAKIPAPTLEATLSNLGDALPYSFAVRACSATDVCDTNENTRSLQMQENGVISSNDGVSDVVQENGGVTLTMPWDESKGAVRKRRTYYKQGDFSSNILDYTTGPVVDVLVSSPDLTNPPRTVRVTNLLENTTYTFITRDEDPSGHRSSNLVYKTLTTGDLTPPAFAGITASDYGTDDPEKTILVRWTAIKSQDPNPVTSQAGDAAGANEYLIYLASSAAPETDPSNSCMTGALVATLPAIDYVEGQTAEHLITGLSPRTHYDVCIKARDKALNLIELLPHEKRITRDVTAPNDHDGAQLVDYDHLNGQLKIDWNPSAVSDFRNYRVKIWRRAFGDTTALDINTPTKIYEPATDLLTIQKLTNPGPDELVITDGDTFTVLVVACDNAYHTGLTNSASQDIHFNTPYLTDDDNCTPSLFANAKSDSVPDITKPEFLNLIRNNFSHTVKTGKLFWDANDNMAKWSDLQVQVRYRSLDTPGVPSDPTASDPLYTYLSPATTSSEIVDGLPNNGSFEFQTIQGIPDKDQQYKFQVQLRDLNNNTEVAYSDVIRIDNKKPDAASSLSWDENTLTKSATITARWTKSQDAELKAEYLTVYRFDSSANSTDCSTNNDGTVVGSETLMSPAPNDFTDTAGNSGSTFNGLSGPYDAAQTFQTIATNADADQKYRFAIRSVDHADNELTTCSPEIRVDRVIPTISKITSTKPDGLYKKGTVIPVEIEFSEPVVISGGSPKLTLETGATDETLSPVGFVPGSTVSKLTYSYTVGADDESSQLKWLAADALDLTGITITDPALNAFDATLPVNGISDSSSGIEKALAIDGIDPTVVSVSSSTAGGVYTTGNSISIQVTFSEPMAFTGTPQLKLAAGSTLRNASAVDLSPDKKVLNFTYTVQSGDSTEDLQYADVDSLILNSGTLTDIAGNNAVRTLPAVTDAASLSKGGADPGDLILDTGVPPSVLWVTSSTPDLTYKSGDTISIQIKFSELVNVTGSPQLRLQLGATPRYASFVNVSPTDTMNFSYTVQAGDNSSDLEYFDTDNSLLLNGGTIKDRVNNEALLALPVLGTAPPYSSLGGAKAIIIDTTSPKIANVTSSSLDQTYKFGDTLSIQVLFDEDLVIDTAGGSPRLKLDTKSGGTYATYTGTTGQRTLNFNYTVETGDASADLQYVLGSFELNGATLKDGVGNNADLTLPATNSTHSLAENKNLVIDGIFPAVANVTSSFNTNGTYKIGDTLTIEVEFSENVTVDTAGGSPTLALETGTSDATLSYTGKKDAKTLNFSYSVQEGHESSDLQYVDTSAFTLSGAVIKDTAGNTLSSVTLPATNSGHSLAENKDLVIDGIRPTVQQLTSTMANGTYSSGAVTIDVVFTEPVKVVSGSPTLKSNITPGPRVFTTTASSADPASSTITFTYTIQPTDYSADLDAENTSALTAVLQDAAGNAMMIYGVPAPGAANSLSLAKDIIVDSVLPEVTGLSDDLVIKQGKTWNWGCTKASCTYRYAIDQSASWTPAGTFDSTVSADKGPGAGIDGTYYIHVQAKDVNGTLSEIVTVQCKLDNTAPGVPSSLTLSAPTSSPSNDPTPTIRVGGVTSGDTIELYADSGCTLPAFKISGTAAGTTVDLTPAALDDGTYNFYANATDPAGNASACSTATVAYVLDRSEVLITGLANSATPIKGKTWNWGCNKSSCTYRYMVDQNATTDPTGTYAATASASVGPGAGINGTYYIHVQALDSAGNVSSVVHYSAVLDNVPPAAPSGLSKLSPMSSPSNISTPTIRVSGVTAGDVAAVYSDSSCITLLGGSTAGASVVDVTLDPLNEGAYTLYANAIDAAGNRSACSTATTNYTYDATGPAITSITPPANSTYVSGANLNFNLSYSEAVTVNTAGGTPRLQLTIGATTRYASYVSGSGTAALVFRYTVVAADNDSDGISIASPAQPNGGTLKDAAGNNASLAFTLPNLTGVKVDNTGPTISSITAPADGTYSTPQNLNFTVTFNEIAAVTGTPRLTLTVGSSTLYANYVSGTGSTSLVFRYAIGASDADADGITMSSPVGLNGGAITDALGNAATLTFAPPSMAGVIVTIPPVPVWSATTTTGAPEGRDSHTAVWTGSKMIVWGGLGHTSNYWINSGGIYDPVANSWTATQTTGAPAIRSGHSAVWTGSRMIIWGGSNEFSNFQSGGLYDPVANTWTTTTTTNAPTARVGHAAFWTGSKMLIWGGSTVTNAGGLYDPVTNSWTATTTTNAPTARINQAAVWTGAKMIVWGGSNSGTVQTGGVYDPISNSWTSTTTTNAPTARELASAVWTGSKMIVWGGNSAGPLQTGGIYDPTTDSWTATTTTNAPGGRFQHVAIWNGSKMIVWGGYSAGALQTGGMYDPTSNSWTETPLSNAPSARYLSAAVWTSSKLIVWGGSTVSSTTGGTLDFGHVAPFTPTSWSATSTTNAPSARNNNTTIWTGAKMIVWGGYNGLYLNTGGLYDPTSNSWTVMSTVNAPTARNLHAATWTGSKMIVWGGYDGLSGDNYSDTGGLYDPATDSWTSMTTSPLWGRGSSVAFWTGSKMIVWGGGDFYGEANDGSLYDPISNSWTAMTMTNAPSATAQPVGVWTGSKMIVWNGLNGGVYDPIANSWTATSSTNAPSNRNLHTAVWTGSKMIIWGGTSGSLLQSGGIYDPLTNSWTATSTNNAPSGRYNHSAVWTGSKMIVWGGYDGGTNVQSGGIYDPTNDSWSATPVASAPSARQTHQAIWADSGMIIWGGGTNTGGILR